ncbi:MAG: thioredoxin [Anaerovoracaceae bacterium]
MLAEVKITKENFENEVINSDRPVLIDFWAAWCGPCRMIAPVIKEIAEESDGKFKVAKVNVDEEPELASAFSIMSIPTMIVFKDGKPYKKVSGLRPKSELLELLK